MMPKRSNTRRSGKTGKARGVVIRTPTEAFERSLARGADSFNLKGKVVFSQATSTTPAAFIVLAPSQLGPRATALATVFSRFRVNSVIIKFMETTSGFQTVLGIVDDASGTEGDAPSSFGGVLETRCSALAFGAQTVPTYLEWRPVDKSKWYYCTSGATGSDPRLVFPAISFVASSGTGSISAEVDFNVTFKGADDTGST
jgi:hypothetical protein